jgi:hypothetical protein
LSRRFIWKAIAIKPCRPRTGSPDCQRGANSLRSRCVVCYGRGAPGRVGGA